jgi:ABC-2 type transport system permease protein
MIRLTRVEFRRLFARRLTAVCLAAVLVVSGVLLFAVWREAMPLSAGEQRAAQVQYEQAHKDWELHSEEYQEECRKQVAEQPDPKPPVEEACRIPEPTQDQFGKPKTVFTEAMPELLLGTSYLLVFAAFLIGASFVGAEFSSGAIGNWLTFEPRRLRVYAGKLVAAAAGMAPLAVVVLTVVVGGTWLIVGYYGSTAGTTAKVWGDLAGTAGRAVVLTAIAGALGGAIALLLRHTAAAIGVAMAYLVIVEGMFNGFAMRLGLEPWMAKLNLDAWVAHGAKYHVLTCHVGPDGMYNCTNPEKVLSFTHGAIYLTVIAAVLIAGGALVFNRRDIN